MNDQDLIDYFDEEAYDDAYREILIESLLNSGCIMARAHPTIGRESCLQVFVGDGATDDSVTYWLGIIQMESCEQAMDIDAVRVGIRAKLQGMYPDREIPAIVLTLWK